MISNLNLSLASFYAALSGTIKRTVTPAEFEQQRVQNELASLLTCARKRLLVIEDEKHLLNPL
ncbi:MAG: hypothetical protein ACREOW_13760 [Thermodesulfobacteriota bacterium]